jgi:heme/copper-type cytochrome/quinol oxidase subunit 4
MVTKQADSRNKIKSPSFISGQREKPAAPKILRSLLWVPPVLGIASMASVATKTLSYSVTTAVVASVVAVFLAVSLVVSVFAFLRIGERRKGTDNAGAILCFVSLAPLFLVALLAWTEWQGLGVLSKR